MATIKDITGQRFGRLTATYRIGSVKNGSIWSFICDCGTIYKTRMCHVTSGKVKSCGCFGKNQLLTHGKSYTKEYKSWQSMNDRTYNKNSSEYYRYGGRGIKICDRWRDSFENFLSDMGPRPSPKHSIDRIDVNGNYEPSNCRWATPTIQSINQRKRKDNKSGTIGVHFCSGKWKATIAVFNKNIYLGRFNTKEEAIAARKSAEEKYHAPLLSAK